MPDLRQVSMTDGATLDHGDVRRFDQDAVMRTYSRQLFLVRGEGTQVFDESGRRYLDFTSGIGVCGLGHCHPALVDAATEQIRTLWHTSNLYLTAPQAMLADRLTAAAGFDRVFFSNSGAEANEAAIKLARRYAKQAYGAKKGEILTFPNSFHGRTLATVTATAQPKYQEGFGPLPGGFRYADALSMDSVRAAVSEKTCAVLIEPIQGEGGVRPVSAEFLRELRAFCDERGILLIFDEVQTGAGRTGSWLAWQRLGVKPDIVTMAKSLAGGLPIGATLSTEAVAAAFSPGAHGSTFGGNPIAARAALAVLDVVLAPGFLDNVRRRGQQLYAALCAIAAKSDRVADVRGAGLMWGVELTSEGAADAVEKCRELGLLALTAGPRTVRLLPPLIVSPQEIEQAAGVLEEAL